MLCKKLTKLFSFYGTIIIEKTNEWKQKIYMYIIKANKENKAKNKNNKEILNPWESKVWKPPWLQIFPDAITNLNIILYFLLG